MKEYVIYRWGYEHRCTNNHEQVQLGDGIQIKAYENDIDYICDLMSRYEYFTTSDGKTHKSYLIKAVATEV